MPFGTFITEVHADVFPAVPPEKPSHQLLAVSSSTALLVAFFHCWFLQQFGPLLPRESQRPTVTKSLPAYCFSVFPSEERVKTLKRDVRLAGMSGRNGSDEAKEFGYDTDLN